MIAIATATATNTTDLVRKSLTCRIKHWKQWTQDNFDDAVHSLRREDLPCSPEGQNLRKLTVPATPTFITPGQAPIRKKTTLDHFATKLNASLVFTNYAEQIHVPIEQIHIPIEQIHIPIEQIHIPIEQIHIPIELNASQILKQFAFVEKRVELPGRQPRQKRRAQELQKNWSLH